MSLEAVVNQLVPQQSVIKVSFLDESKLKVRFGVFESQTTSEIRFQLGMQPDAEAFAVSLDQVQEIKEVSPRAIARYFNLEIIKNGKE